MGTNYYLKRGNSPEIHIGKNSCGWSFIFHETDKCFTPKDWFRKLLCEDCEIEDEYGRIIPKLDFFKMVLNSKDHECVQCKNMLEEEKERVKDGFYMFRGEFS